MKQRLLYARMLGFVKPHAPLLALALALTACHIIFEALSLWVSAALPETLFGGRTPDAVAVPFALDSVYAYLKYRTYRLIAGPSVVDTLKTICLLVVASFLAKNVCIYLKNLVMTRANLHIVRDIRDRLYRHVLDLPVSYFDKSRSGETISRIINDVTSVNTSMTGTFDKLLTEPARVLFFVVVMLTISVRMTVAAAVIFPVLGWCIVTIGRVVRRRSRRVLERMAGIFAILHETIGGIRTVKMFSMGPAEAAKFRAENRAYTRHAFRAAAMGAVSSPLTETLGAAVAAGLLWYAGRDVLNAKGMSAGDFMRFLIFLFSTFKPLKSLGGVNNALQTGFAAAERVFGVLDRSPEPLPAAESAKAELSFSREIRLTGVSFAYPECTEEVLRDISLTIEKGTVVALVGPSGSGKSTLLDCLPRFYDVTAGAITIDGTDIGDVDLVALRSLFGIVAQETVLFNETVANNIAYGRPGATGEEIVTAARASHAWEFIEQMPDGLDTVIGERGVTLSGGQRQRLSIARALLRNPPILILDEATSALDTESERLVQNAIHTLMENRTALVVAHRLSTIRHADAIAVLEAGRVVEQGTHEELLARNGRYRYYYDMQFSSVKET